MIYVDQPIHPWRGKKWCHLVADDIQELHDFAQRLGLKSEWFQNQIILPHYELTEAKREAAIKLGAKSLTTKQMSARVTQILLDRRKGKV